MIARYLAGLLETLCLHHFDPGLKFDDDMSWHLSNLLHNILFRLLVSGNTVVLHYWILDRSSPNIDSDDL